MKRGLLLTIGLMLSLPFVGSAQLTDMADGVNWEKTLRIRGIMQPFDPFNESNLYKVTNDVEGSKSLTSNSENVQFEMVASNFWIGLRDSLQTAIQNDEVDVYTVRESTIEGQDDIFVKGTKVTYNDLLDSLSVNLVNDTDPNDRINQMYNITLERNRPQSALVRRYQSQQNRVFEDLSLISLYEVELKVSVDETGFQIKPLTVLFGTTHWSSPATVNLENILETSFDKFGKGIGFAIDLTSEKTLSYLVENGVQFSGERNIFPFYDLITLFHYDYMVYAESNNVLAQGFQKFGYELDDLRQTILNRYNDLTYTYLYGQPPQWWEEGKKGGFTNGMYQIDSLNAIRASQNQAQQGGN